MPSTPTKYWMPNDGIQAWRSTNWKSARVGSKRLQSSSVAANTSSDAPRAVQRMTASRRPSLLSIEQQQQRAGERQEDDSCQHRYASSS